MLDAFCNSLNDVGLQRHLLATQPADLTQAVQHSEEYLQIKANQTLAGSSKIQVMNETESTPKADVMTELMRAIQQLTEQVERLTQKTTDTQSGNENCPQ